MGKRFQQEAAVVVVVVVVVIVVVIVVVVVVVVAHPGEALPAGGSPTRVRNSGVSVEPSSTVHCE